MTRQRTAARETICHTDHFFSARALFEYLQNSFSFLLDASLHDHSIHMQLKP